MMNKLLVLSLLGLLTACSNVELNEINPVGVNLSGEWVLDFTDSDAAPDLREGLHGSKKRPRHTEHRTQALEMANGSALAFIVHDFQILRADKIEIEQNRDSMGIQYHPGVYRDLTWGERQRGLWEVYAGWEDTDLVIISKANDMLVTERLSRIDNRLWVVVTVDADGDERSFSRVFNLRT